MDLKEIMNFQPVVIIGIIGNTSNGKTTLTRNLSGIEIHRHSTEIKSNHTIKLGYANIKIFKCQKCIEENKKLKTYNFYKNADSLIDKLICEYCNKDMILDNHISFVDVPGHQYYFETMANGVNIMDCAIIIESARDKIFPSSMTVFHYNILKSKNIPVLLTCLNKIDLINKSDRLITIKTIKTIIENKTGVNLLIPISAYKKINLDILIEYLSKAKPKNIVRDDKCMIIQRSFNINNNKLDINNLSKMKGSVVGGCIISGSFKVNDNIILFPGRLNKEKNTYKPLNSIIQSINTENIVLKENISAYPGALLGIQLDLDPTIGSNDNLSGYILYKEDEINSYLMINGELSLKIFIFLDDVEFKKDKKIQLDFIFYFTNVIILDYKDKILKVKLENPVIIKSDISLNEISIFNNCKFIGKSKIETYNKMIKI